MQESIFTVLDDFQKSLDLTHTSDCIKFEVFKQRLIHAVGNSAEVRRSLLASTNVMETILADGNHVEALKAQIEKNKHSLELPPRNCDLYSNTSLANEAWKSSGSRQAYSDWLTTKV